jgi:hypothetical protein
MLHLVLHSELHAKEIELYTPFLCMPPTRWFSRNRSRLQIGAKKVDPPSVTSCCSARLPEVPLSAARAEKEQEENPSIHNASIISSLSIALMLAFACFACNDLIHNIQSPYSHSVPRSYPMIPLRCRRASLPRCVIFNSNMCVM